MTEATHTASLSAVNYESKAQVVSISQGYKQLYFAARNEDKILADLGKWIQERRLRGQNGADEHTDTHSKGGLAVGAYSKKC